MVRKPLTEEQRFQAALDRIETLGGHSMFDRTIRAVVLAETGVADEDLGLFQDLPDVQILDLSNTTVGDVGLGQLIHLAALEDLVLINTKVSEQAIEAFRRDHPSVRITMKPSTGPRTNPFTGEPM